MQNPYRAFTRYGLSSSYNQSVDVVAYHVFIIDKQIVVTVTAITELLAEAGCHIPVLARFAPQRAVIATEVKAISRKLLLVFHSLPEKAHISCSTIFFDCGKPDTLTVYACARRNAVLVKGFFQIGLGDFAQPVVRMRGKPGKFLVFQN